MPKLRNMFPDWKNHDDRFWCTPMDKPVPPGLPKRSPTSADCQDLTRGGPSELKTVQTPRPAPLLRRRQRPRLVFLHGAGGQCRDPLLAELANSTTSTRRWCPATATARMPDPRHAGFHPAHLGRGRGAGAEGPDPRRPLDGRHDRRRDGGGRPNEVSNLCLIAPAGLWVDDHPIADLFATLPYEMPALLFHDAEAGAGC